MQSIGYSVTAVGRLWSLTAAGEVICFMLAGHLADLWGRKRVLLVGIVCMAFVFLGYTLSDAVVWIIAVQVVRSFAYACFEAPAMLLATELGLRAQRGRLASLYYFASGVGGITGSVAGGAIARNFGYVTMIRGVVCLMLVGAVVTAALMPRLRATDPPS
jgi:MFS family permease